MKILLLGEYSNLHWTLAQGLRHLGCDVTVASSGDSFKGYYRDVNLTRKSYNLPDTLKYVYQVAKNFYRFKGFDVVQVVNPVFLDLKVDRNLEAFNYLKKHNGKVFLGAFGDDAYLLKACLSKNVFRYSEFQIPGRVEYLPSAQKLIDVWSNPDKVKLNKEIAERSDGIIACLYEYYVSYQSEFDEKLTYIPEPINTSELSFKQRGVNEEKLKFFIGIQMLRTEIKGTDVMFRVLERIKQKYSNECDVLKAESVPYREYVKMMENSDVLLDQLYSYSTGMNGLSAMAQGLVVVGGGEPEVYDLQGEVQNKPIVNVVPTEDDLYNKLQSLILNKQAIANLSLSSRAFIEKHHDYIKVARRYIDTWMNS